MNERSYFHNEQWGDTHGRRREVGRMVRNLARNGILPKPGTNRRDPISLYDTALK